MNWNIAVILVLGGVSCSLPGLYAQYRPFYSGYGPRWNGGGFSGGYGFNSRYRGYSPYVQPGLGGGFFFNRGLKNGVQGSSSTGFPQGFQIGQPQASKQQEDLLWKLREANFQQPFFGAKSTTKGPNVGQQNLIQPQPSAGLLSTAVTPPTTTRFQTPADTTRILPAAPRPQPGATRFTTVTEPTPIATQSINFTPQQAAFNDVNTNSIDVDSFPAPKAVSAEVPAPVALTPAPAVPQFQDQAPEPVFATPATPATSNFDLNRLPPQPQFQPNLRDFDIPPGFSPLPDGANELGQIDPDFLEFLKPVPAVPGLPFQPSLDPSTMTREQMEKVMRFLQFQPFILDPVPAVPELSQRN